MDIARIAVLLEPFLEQPLPPSRLDQISIYIDLLHRWNTRINLTAIRQEEEIVTRHFGESFFMARHLFPVRPIPFILTFSLSKRKRPLAFMVLLATGYWVLATALRASSTSAPAPGSPRFP